jgi:hypothetical protein
MITYKITNLTGALPKRAPKYNTNASITYADGLMKKTINIKPSDVVYLTVTKLPIGAHRLRMLKIIDVKQVSQSEIPVKPPPLIAVDLVTVIPHGEPKKTRKTVIKKEDNIK